jgi:hypothetical protein
MKHDMFSRRRKSCEFKASTDSRVLSLNFEEWKMLKDCPRWVKANVEGLAQLGQG